ncbi:unnamed protein product [Rhizoctonia solani]|uniref:Protein kinase domain-containing protein n=1 Tax=Rhizoctonia solani TaxID=456999 RepID=A0A8H3CMP2_9AGAM|nr:unnamed protein product [Rhizoctonia solani]
MSKFLRVLSPDHPSRPGSVASVRSDHGDITMEDGTSSTNKTNALTINPYSKKLSHSRASSVVDDQKPQNELRALASLSKQCALSLIDVADELKPVPFIGPLMDNLTFVFRAVERTRVNKEQWKLLQGRCVMVLRIGGAQVMNNGQQHYPGLAEATQLLEKTLDTIIQRVEYYNKMNDTFALLKHQAISEEIEGFFGQLDYCLRLFSYSADVAQAQWIGEFRAVRERELANIERLQDELTEMKIDMQGIDQKEDMTHAKLDRIDIALRQLLDNKSAILREPSATTADTFDDAQQIIRTILSVTKLQLPPKLLLGRQCILDANVPTQTGITCDVYLASFLGGEKVAKKVFRLGISDQKSVEKYASRFLRIAKLWSELRSDYTLPFYGVGMEPSGRNNHFQLDNSGAKKNILQIVTDAALGLQYLHNRRTPVVHSGMKGSNILISDSGGGVLGGFGLTKALTNDEDSDLPVVMTGKTEAQRWMAPEMFDDEPVLTTHCDVWGWAMATLEIVSGSIPYYRHKQDMNVMLKILQGPPKRKDYPKFDDYAYKPEELWSLLEECWAQEPEKRPTMDEVVVGLKKIARMPE